MIRLLRDCNITIGHWVDCGDSSCCSWLEWNNEKGTAGETYDEERFQETGLIEGVDYEFVKE